MSAGSHTVEIMNANTPPAATPPQPGSVEHWAAWLDRYGDDYATDDERRAAYQDFTTNLAEMQAVFSQPEDMHVAGYLEAQGGWPAATQTVPTTPRYGFRPISTASPARIGSKASAPTSSHKIPAHPRKCPLDHRRLHARSLTSPDMCIDTFNRSRGRRSSSGTCQPARVAPRIGVKVQPPLHDRPTAVIQISRARPLPDDRSMS